MARATQNEARLAYVVERTAGTTPPTPAFTIIRGTGESINAARRLGFSSELDGLRGERNFAVLSTAGEGGFNFEFTDGTLDAFFESALRGTWATNTLKDAKTPKTFTVETTFEQGATDTFKRILGAEVDTLSLNVRAGQIVTGSVAFKALAGDYVQTGLTGATYAAGNTEPIETGPRVGNLTMSGLTVDSISAITLNINNNMRERLILGQTGPDELAPGKLEVTGQITMFCNSSEIDVIRAALDTTSTGLTFRLGATTLKKTNFNLPNIILSNLKMDAESADGNDIMLTVDCRALQATSLSGSVIQITRDVA